MTVTETVIPPVAAPRPRVDWHLILAGLLALYLLSGLYLVATDQQGVVVRFGRVVAPRVPAGVHWTWPVPIAHVYRLRVRETRRLTLGLRDDQPLAQAQFLTGDQNIVNIRLVLQFTIADPVAYLFRTADLNARLEDAARAALVQVVAARPVDDLLTTGKVEAQQEVQAAIQATLTRDGCGLSLLGVVLDAIVPPDEVVDAFRLVSSAREDSDRLVKEAESYANGLIPVARGDAARLHQEALGYDAQTVDTALGDAAHFGEVAREYVKAPRDTTTRLYLETMEEVLPKVNKTIVGADGKSVNLGLLREP